MSRHDTDQPLTRRRRGFTLIEALAGIALAAALALASAALIRAGALAYRYTAAQSSALDAARAAAAGNGARRGVVWSGQSARSVAGLLSSSVTFVSPTSSAVYYWSSRSLYRSTGAAASALASPLTTVSFSYYNMNSSGLIIQSTSAASATLVTAVVASPGLSSGASAYAGALLRNHP